MSKKCLNNNKINPATKNNKTEGNKKMKKKNSKISPFEKELKMTYQAIEKVNPEFALNFHYNKHGQIVLDDAYIVASNGTDYVPCDDEKFIDFITNNKGEIEFYIRFNNSGIDLPVETFSL